ncbi:MAG: S8 family serine peptidase [Candidatus Eisenbacteria bacterium]|nr:S8 family serine peptidase [Candidatus Eisenbacteria bacterium]
MGRISLLFALFLVLSGVFVAPPAGAAQIQPWLEEQLAALGDDDYLSVILIMETQADITGLNQSLKSENANLTERHERVVRALKEAAVSQKPLLDELESAQAGGGKVIDFTGYWISNLVVAKVTKAYLYDLAKRADIGYIEPNFSVELIEPIKHEVPQGPVDKEAIPPTRGIGVTPGLRAINADDVWYDLGITGAGTLVANCDTGVQGDHPALGSRWRGNFAPASECWLNLIGGAPSFPYDGYGHGTHVMGTITGLGAATQDTIGVAWGAHWIATDPINQSVSYEFNNDIITAYQWFADPDGDPSTTDDVPDVIQNSWRINEGFGLDYTDCDTRWWAVIDNCEAAGAVTTWSAGNEGSGAQTIGSPADRATTLTNAFSVGAIDATNYGFPYPIAGFSSRGPTGCNVPAEQRIKPEVCAPGVGVYSSVPTSTYEGGWDGTSMAGPHVAGVVALMREANPDLDVDTIKEILMQTARDEGTAGEDNTYGWGVIDAYAAVEAAMTGFGRLEGMVKNASNGNTPIAGVEVQIVEPGRSTRSDATGAYAMSVAPGIYTVRTNHPSFATQVVPNVAILVDQTRVQNFNLVDIGAPVITNTTDLRSTDNTVGPYAVQSTITDFSSLAHARLYYRVNGHPFQMIELTPGLNDLFSANIPGQGYTSLVEYYITAADVAGNQASDPPEADPPQYYSFYVAPIVSFLNDAIEGGAPGWSHAVDGSGFVDQWHISTTRDHTTGGGHSWKCGDTGTGDYASLLNACLVTPSIELGLDSYLRFWHWMEAETSSAYPQYAYDGGIVEISVDGGAWQQIFPEGGYNYIVRAGSTPGPFPAGMQFFSGTHDWQQVTFNLSAYSEQEARIRFRFGSDGADVREGWYVDDIVVDGFMIDASATNEGPAPRGIFLHPADPNPFTGETHLHYQLNAASDVRLQVFDPSGRLVRTLVSGTRQPGSYETVWDSRDDAMRSVAPGIYFSRLQAGGSVVSQKLIVTR